jgi:hypothetical protein
MSIFVRMKLRGCRCRKNQLGECCDAKSKSKYRGYDTMHRNIVKLSLK